MSKLVWSRREMLAQSLASSAVVGSMALTAGRVEAAPLATKEPLGSRISPGDDVVWLDGGAPSAHEGQSWGQPWPRGTRLDKRGYVLEAAGGKREAVQTWPMAWWPDGSIKWTGHATAANGARTGSLRVVPGTAKPEQTLSVYEAGDAITVTVGQTVWNVGKSGEALIRSARVGASEVLQSVRLLASAQDRPDDEDGAPTLACWTAPPFPNGTGSAAWRHRFSPLKGLHRTTAPRRTRHSRPISSATGARK